jgi:Rap1a immunity proteins
MMRATALSVLSISVGAGAFAQDTNSANWIMPGCRAFINGNMGAETFKAGVCAGVVSGVPFGGNLINICLPDGVTPRQMALVVTAYVDRNPARMHEPFALLAYEAMSKAWPCKR